LQQRQFDTAPSGSRTQYDYLIINYTGFPNVPACGGLDTLIAGKAAELGGIFCNTTAGIHTIRTYVPGQADLYPFWLDLTSKLRPA
jgi:hypothetical protein